jgi:hypothetical protein
MKITKRSIKVNMIQSLSKYFSTKPYRVRNSMYVPVWYVYKLLLYLHEVPCNFSRKNSTFAWRQSPTKIRVRIRIELALCIQIWMRIEVKSWTWIWIRIIIHFRKICLLSLDVGFPRELNRNRVSTFKTDWTKSSESAQPKLTKASLR